MINTEKENKKEKVKTTKEKIKAEPKEKPEEKLEEKPKEKNREDSFIKFFIFLILKLIFFIVFLLGFSAAGILGGAMYAYYSNTPKANPSDFIIDKNLTSYIHDSENNIMAELTGSQNINREEILFEELPQHMVDAVIAIEDERFYEHSGIDIKRIAGSFIGLVKNRGDVDENQGGASTITQQLIKLVTERNKVSFERKIQEWFIAMDLEMKMTKNQIIEKYLNVVSESNGYYGVGTAARKYFGKYIGDITIAEAALLAGIPRAPSLYNPRTENGYKLAIERQQTILMKMRELNLIDEQEYLTAKNERIEILEAETNGQSLTVQTYFVDETIKQVARALSEKYEISYRTAVNNVYNNGYRIYTTMVPSVQKAIDEVYNDSKYIYQHNKRAKMYGETPQSGIVVINHQNGHVAGMYGGLGEKTASMVQNRATDIKRQSGSSIKPISVYGPGIDMRIITPGTVVDDVPIYMLGTESEEGRYPTNFDRVYNGLTSVRNGLKASVNVVATRLLMETVTVDKSREYLKKVGIDISDEDANISGLALGGLHNGVSPLQMASAFAPFANKGLYHEPIFFTKVYDKDGKEILSTEPVYRTVYDEKAAYLMLDMMKEVVGDARGKSIYGISPIRGYPSNGTATSIKIKGKDGKPMPTAGKTGTTSDNIDKWFVGYTPYYSAAVWYGYDNNIKPIEIAPSTIINGDSYSERATATTLWNDVMNKIHENLEIIEFEEPSGIVEREICIYSGKLATELCKEEYRGDASFKEIFIKGTEPRGNVFCDIHVEVELCTESAEEFKIKNTDDGGKFVEKLLLAGEYCPEGSRVKQILVQRPEGKEIQLIWHPNLEDSEEFIEYEKFYYHENREHYNTDAYPLDWAYEKPIGEYCTIHSMPEEEQNIEDAENAGSEAAEEINGYFEELID